MTFFSLILLASAGGAALLSYVVPTDTDATEPLVEVARYGGLGAHVFYIAGGLLLILTLWIWVRRGR